MSAPVTDPDAGPGAPAGGRVARALAALGLAAAGVVHVLAALEHAGHGGPTSAFLAGAAVLQLLAAGQVLIGRPGTRVLLGLLGITLVLLVLYLVSRRIPLPLGTHGSDRPEDADVLGTLAVVAELLTLAALPTLLPPRLRRDVGDAVLMTGMLAWLAWLSGYLG